MRSSNQRRTRQRSALAWSVIGCGWLLSCGRSWTFLDDSPSGNDGLAGGAAGASSDATEAGAPAASGGAAANGSGSGGSETAGEAGAAGGPGVPGEVVWSRVAGGPARTESVDDIAVDSAGNVFVVGQIGSSVSFGCETHDVAGSADAFLVKFTPDGRCAWSKTFGAGADGARVFATGIDVSSEGNVIVAGFFDNVVDFGGGPLLPESSFDAYLAKFSAEGEPVWSRRYGTTADEWVWDVALDRTGSIYVVGHYNGRTDFGRGPLPVFGFNDLFIAKFADADDASGGDPLWARGYGASGSGTDSLVAVGVAEGGEVIAAGSFEATVDFDGTRVTATGNKDLLITRHAPEDGRALWVRAHGGLGDDRIRALALGGSSAWAAGWFSGAVDFGGVPLESAGSSRDALLLEVDLSEGQTRSAERLGGPFEDGAEGLSRSAEGRIALGGYFEGTIPELGGGFSAVAGQDAFIVTLDEQRRRLWAGRYGGASNDVVRSLAWDASDTFVVGGQFAETIELAAPPFRSEGEPDLFLARFRPPLER